MNVGFSNVNAYSYNSSFKHTSTQTISKEVSSSTPSQKVLGYEVDENGYFKSDFNKAAGIPEDFKIHSDTMKSLVSMNENANIFYKSFSNIDIAKTAGNAYKILTQLIDEDTLKKNNFSREDLIAIPQGYEVNRMNMQVTKIYNSTAEYMGATGETRAENHDITTTFFNHSVQHYWDSPTGGKLRPATNIFDSNTGGKEQKNTGTYFNTTADKYTNSDGSVTKGGLLVGIINKNLYVREGKTTFWGKMWGFDKNVSAKQAQTQDKLFSMMYPKATDVPDSVLDSLPDDFKQYIKDAQKMFKLANGHFSSSPKDEEIKLKSPVDYLYEQMKEDEKAMLKNLQKKAREAKLEEQEAEFKKQEKLLEELRKKSQESLSDFTNSFLQVQETHNKSNSLQNQVNITELELKKAFLGMFDFSKNEFEKKSFLDLSV